MHSLFPSLLPFGLLALAVCAQDVPPALPSSALPADVFRVALHADPEDDRAALWASGDTFKVRLDVGCEFHPLLGEDAPRSLPLRWRTLTLEVGGRRHAAADAPARRHTDWRCELDHGAFVEAYDVRADGVEQTFTLPRPLGHGDLVVRGRIEGPLHAAPVDGAHQTLAFRDAEGREVVTYGAATAIDAHGRRHAMHTAFDGEQVELRLDGAWLATTAYPVVIDPLISAGDVVSHLTDGTIGGVQVASSDLDPRRLLVVYHRAFSSGDRDVFGYSCSAGFMNPSRVFSRTGSFDDNHPSVAFHAASNRWVIAFERKWATGRNVHVYLHPRDSLTENGGSTLSVPLVSGEDTGRPVVGGTRMGSNSPYALLAYETDRGTSVPEVVTIKIHVAAAQFVGTPQHVGSTSATVVTSRGRPAINQVGAFSQTGWVVAFEQDSLTGGVAIAASRYDSDGNKVSSATLIPSDPSSHAVEPRIAGAGTGFALTAGRRALATGSPVTAILARRITWPLGSAPVLAAIRTLDVGGGSLSEQFSNGSIAFDWHSSSQWVATYLSTMTTSTGTTTRGLVVRLGATCGVIETTMVDPTHGRPTAIACTYDWESDVFPITYGTQTLQPLRNVVRGATYRYPDAAQATPYGTSCSTATIGSTRPLAGNEYFGLHVTGINQPTPAGVLLLSTVQTILPLEPIGMPGCTLLVGTSPLVQLPVTGASGILSLRIPLSDAPVLRGRFNAQYAYLDAQANALGVRTTSGLAVQVQ
ncbi:MAG TPA: hypothetical protein VK081_02110 [Planctomycetota bacterium]|nr:hypothetical protein [Planctomycetota bacterium]